MERHKYSPSVNPQKHGVIFRQGGKSCGALHGRGDSPSVYPLMTLPVWCLVIIPSFTSIACTLREEFSNRQKRLYENIYIDSDHSLGSDCVHYASANHPHFTTLFHIQSTLHLFNWSNMCYLRQPQVPCVHCSDVPLTGLHELCSSALLWLCLTILHFNCTCSALDMVWTWHACSSACVVLSHRSLSACCMHSFNIWKHLLSNL